MSLLFAKYNTVAFVILFLITVGTSCKKENDVISLTNRAPLANAGRHQNVFLPDNEGILDGSSSTDPDNNITSYIWTKISGPLLFNIIDTSAIRTKANNLIQGVYLFELKLTDSGGMFSTDTVQIIVLNAVQPSNDNNVIFFFRDPTGGLEAEDIWVIEGLGAVLAKVTINGFPDAEIGGVWSNAFSPWCPISSIYVDANSFGSFELPPGTYNWVAESVTVNLDGYPGIPDSFRQYWGAGPHKAEGTIAVQQGDCVLKEIIFL